MRGILRNFFISILLIFFTDASAQLLPEVMADKYLVQAEQLFEKKDYIAALNMVEKIIALQKEHSFTLPNEFHFQYAQVAFSTGATHAAFDAVSKYLSAEQEGEFYEEALVLLIKIEEELAKFEVPEFSPENTCFGKPAGSNCWMALTNQPECYVWNPNLDPNGTMTWSGACSGGFAQGMGTLSGNFFYDDYHIPIRRKKEEKGQLQNGKKHGHWVESFIDSTIYVEGDSPHSLSVAEGLYVEGKRHGYWVTHLDSTIYEAGPYMDGKKHGDWVHYFSEEGQSIYNVHIGMGYDDYGIVSLPGYGDTHHEAVSEGPYVSGKRHGDWVVRRYCEVDGNGMIIKQEGPYVAGKRHGHWVAYFPDGNVEAKGSYANDERHGHWIWYNLDGRVQSSETY